MQILNRLQKMLDFQERKQNLEHSKYFRNLSNKYVFKDVEINQRASEVADVLDKMSEVRDKKVSEEIKREWEGLFSRIGKTGDKE